MTDDQKDMQPATMEIPLTEDGIPMVANGEPLTETAIQALREARERARNQPAQVPLPREINGPKRDEEPTRYGDWEKNGKTSDF